MICHKHYSNETRIYVNRFLIGAPVPRESTDARYMGRYFGTLFGNGKYGDDCAGHIKEGQIVSIEADLDKGTLRFWVDGKPHGPGWSSGVTGRLRWAVCLYYNGTAVQIVPTPELQPWGMYISECSL